MREMGVKYPINESFFNTWSDRMAYVLGYIYADGNLEDSAYIRGKYIRVTSIDLERIESIKELMGSAHSIRMETRRSKGKQRFLLRIGSAKLFDSLHQLGITPRKSSTMLFPTIPPKYISHFVRGYFDGDGCVHIDKAYGKPKRLSTVFTSGSKKFLQSLQKFSQENLRTGGGIYAHGSAQGTFQLRYSTRDSLRLFLFMYSTHTDSKLHLKRKYDIFNQYLALRGLSGRDVTRVLDQKGPVVKR